MPPVKSLRLKTANGGEMPHEGQKEITFRTGTGDEVLGLVFQVTNVQKALAAAWRIVEKGSIIQMGPKRADNFIKNIETGKKIPLYRVGGTYVMRVQFVAWREDGVAVDDVKFVEGGQVFQRQV